MTAISGYASMHDKKEKGMDEWEAVNSLFMFSIFFIFFYLDCVGQSKVSLKESLLVINECRNCRSDQIQRA